MNARLWLNVLLFVFLALLLALAVYESDQKSKSATALTALQPADIEHIVITRRSGEVLRFERRNDVWWLTAPVEVPANSVRVQAIVQVVGAASLSHFPVEGRDLEDFGMLNPAVRLTLNETELMFGGLSPLDQRRYVRIDDTVHLIADGLFYDLVEAMPAYVSRALLPSGAQIERVRLPEFTVSKSESGTWQVQPAVENVSADGVQRWLQRWRDAHAVQVTRYQETATIGEIAMLWSAQDAPVVWRVTKREPELVLARPELGLQYHFSRAQAEELMRLTSMSSPAAVERD